MTNKQSDWRVRVFDEIMKWPEGRDQTLALIEHILFSGGRILMQPEGGANVVWDDDEDEDDDGDAEFFKWLEKQKTQSP